MLEDLRTRQRGTGRHALVPLFRIQEPLVAVQFIAVGVVQPLDVFFCNVAQVVVHGGAGNDGVARKQGSRS